MDNEKKPSTNILTIGLDSSQYASSSSFSPVDNGTGISDKQKIMTPYYTTKKEGTGLGLPIVNKIINEHSGDFTINNNKNSNGVKIEVVFS